MNETARDSIAAIAITVLRGLRTVTKVAKPSRAKPVVVPTKELKPSFFREGNTNRKCLRYSSTGNRFIPADKSAKVVYSNGNISTKYDHVFKFEHEDKTYYIVAPSIQTAKKTAKSIMARKIARYAGLAKRALSLLMFKTNTKRVNDGLLNPVVETKAMEVTSKREVLMKRGDSGGSYSMILQDGLLYAKLAIKGGQSTIDIQMKKASNKIASIINRKIKGGGFLANRKLETPFPELVRKRK